MSEEKNCPVCPDSPEEAASEVVEAWNKGTKGDVLGSYSGMGADGGDPEQDADDL
jgi:hypothetical protein